MFNIEQKKEQLQALKDQGSNKKYDMYFKGQTREFEVHDVPIDLLTWNPANGRIVIDTRTWQQTNDVELNPENEEFHQEIIKGFIWNLKPDKNQRTLQSLRTKGQQVPGVITSDGYIVSGNRRAMLIDKLNNEAQDDNTHRPFKAVILDETYSGNRKVLLELEKLLQHDVEDPEKYRANAKYFELEDMLNEGFTAKEININFGWHKKSEKEIQQEIDRLLRVKDLMTEYLEFFDMVGLLSRLDEQEPVFVDLEKYLQAYNVEEQNFQYDRPYTRQDLEELKHSYFYLVAANWHNDKGYREIGKNSNQGRNSFFGRTKTWDSWTKGMEEVARIFDELPSIDDYKRDNPSIEIEQLTKRRLEEFSDQVTPIFKETYGKTESLLKDSTSEERPADILKRIENALEKLDKECVGNDEIWNPKKDGIYDSVKNIRDWMDKHVRDFKKHL